MKTADWCFRDLSLVGSRGIFDWLMLPGSEISKGNLHILLGPTKETIKFRPLSAVLNEI